MSSLVIEGLEEKPSSGFVALAQLGCSGPSISHSPSVEARARLEPQGAD
jgi:hypothetical protein